jgi:hypothetical protein
MTERSAERMPGADVSRESAAAAHGSRRAAE